MLISSSRGHRITASKISPFHSHRKRNFSTTMSSFLTKTQVNTGWLSKQIKGKNKSLNLPKTPRIKSHRIDEAAMHELAEIQAFEDNVRPQIVASKRKTFDGSRESGSLLHRRLMANPSYQKEIEMRTPYLNIDLLNMSQKKEREKIASLRESASTVSNISRVAGRILKVADTYLVQTESQNKEHNLIILYDLIMRKMEERNISLPLNRYPNTEERRQVISVAVDIIREFAVYKHLIGDRISINFDKFLARYRSKYSALLEINSNMKDLKKMENKFLLKKQENEDFLVQQYQETTKEIKHKEEVLNKVKKDIFHQQHEIKEQQAKVSKILLNYNTKLSEIKVLSEDKSIRREDPESFEINLRIAQNGVTNSYLENMAKSKMRIENERNKLEGLQLKLDEATVELGRLKINRSYYREKLKNALIKLLKDPDLLM